MDTAIEHLQQSADLADMLSEPTARIAALNNLALAQGETGDRSAGIALLEEALRLCTEQQDRHREAALHNNLADLWHREGNRERSMEHLKRAVAIFAEIGSARVNDATGDMETGRVVSRSSTTPRLARPGGSRPPARSASPPMGSRRRR